MHFAAWHNSSESFHQKNKEAKQRFSIWVLFRFWNFDAVSLRERSVSFIYRCVLTNVT